MVFCTGTGTVPLPGNPGVLAVVSDEMLGEYDDHLPAHHLVAVHVGHPLEHGPAHHPLLTHSSRDLGNNYRYILIIFSTEGYFCSHV